MTHIVVFNILWLTCCAYALHSGGAPERWAAALEIVAIFLTTLVQALFRAHRYYTEFSTGIFVIDSVFLIALCAIALTADRFWPMLAAGFQVADIAVHLCKLAAPEILSLGYGIGIASWVYPKLILFAIGTWRHQQRLARYGKDPAWSRRRCAASERISSRSS